jgi:hypothetical protein
MRMMKLVDLEVNCWKNRRLLRVQTLDMFETYAIACHRTTHINGTQSESRPFCLTCHHLGRLARSEGDGEDRLDFLL